MRHRCRTEALSSGLSSSRCNVLGESARLDGPSTNVEKAIRQRTRPSFLYNGVDEHPALLTPHSCNKGLARENGSGEPARPAGYRRRIVVDQAIHHRLA